MPPLADPPKEEDGLKTLAAKWLFAQSIPSVLLFCIIGMLYQGGRYVLDVAIPSQINAINKGYSDIADRHRAEREARDKAYLKVFKDISNGKKPPVDSIDEDN